MNRAPARTLAKAEPAAASNPRAAKPVTPAVSNQALQQELHSRARRFAPIAVGRADDPAERAADKLAGNALSETRQTSVSGPPWGSPGRLFTGAGHPLEPATRRFFEPRLGLELGEVRVHRDADTAEQARRLGARAFTAGRDIGFAAGAYAPETQAGQRLLAHELAHMRLDPSGAVLRRQPDTSSVASTSAGPNASTSQSALNQSSVTNAPSPTPDPHATVDPTRIDARSLSNANLIARDVQARNAIEAATASTPLTEAWRQLRREIADERTRRIGLGFVFLAEQSDSSPTMLLQMRAGPVAGTIELVTADISAAMGGGTDLTLGGAIMTPRQMRAYIATLGYQTFTGPAAEAALANRGAIIQRAMQADPLRAPTLPGPIGRTPYPDYSLAGGFRPYGPGQGPGALPFNLADANFRGRVGEILTAGDYRTGWGTGLQDLNRLPWLDVTGRSQMGNFPVLDFGPGSGVVPRILDIRPISVTTSGAATFAERRQQYTAKIEALLDVPGRRTAAPAGTDLVLQHLRQASGDAALAAGTPAAQQAQARFLSDTMFAVPDANLAALRNAIAHPQSAPPGGTNRMIARPGGFRDLYADALRSSPIQLTLRDGTTLTCNSLAELAARAPISRTFTVEGSTANYPPAQRVSAVEFDRAMGVLGQTAASRIVGISNAPAMAAAADAARAGPGGGLAATPTKILEIDSADLSYIGERIGRGLEARTGGGSGPALQWTTAAQSDPVLSAVRNLTGNQALQRGTPEFEAARRQVLGDALLAINADDVQAFRGVVQSDAAWDGRLRASFGAAMADTPIALPDGHGGVRTFRSPDELDAARATMTPEQYSQARAQAQSLVAGRVTSIGGPTSQLGRLEDFRNTAVTRLGGQAESVLHPDVIAHVRLGSARATAESFGRGGGLGMLIGVVTTAGTMYIDEQEHPHWAQELALTGARDFAISGTQSSMESGLTYLAARQALARGTPLTGLSRFGARAGPAALFAGGIELYNISQEQREHSGTEVVTRTGRAMAIAIVSMEIGAAAGSIVPGAGTAAGAVVGFLVGAALGVLSGLFLDSVVPGGAEAWNAEAAAEQARRMREAEAMREAMAPRVMGGFGRTTTLTPIMSSPDITEEEQMAIARWATLLTIAHRTLPAGTDPGATTQ